MLYDEEGRAYVERPILPEDINTFWIVADYRRMYNQQANMERKIKQLAEKNSQMSHYNFFMRGKLKELYILTKKLVKQMRMQGIDISDTDLTAIFDAACVVFPKKKAGRPDSI